MSKYCDVQNSYGYTCGNPAGYFVHFYSDGGGGRLACGKHLAKAVAVVLSAENVRGLTVTVAKLSAKGVTR